jgi:hypothetical protein
MFSVGDGDTGLPIEAFVALNAPLLGGVSYRYDLTRHHKPDRPNSCDRQVSRAALAVFENYPDDRKMQEAACTAIKYLATREANKIILREGGACERVVAAMARFNNETKLLQVRQDQDLRFLDEVYVSFMMMVRLYVLGSLSGYAVLDLLVP